VLQAWVSGPHTPVALQSPLAMYCSCELAGQVVGSNVQLLRCSQPPLPSQLPLAPQAPGAAAGQVAGLVGRGALPPARLAHTPALPGSLQLWQPPPQSLSQHTPSAEHTSPAPQSLLAAQASPAASFTPQRLLVLRQVSWLLQSASTAQVLRQVGLAPLQR
jgi:hypothetical protein